MYLESLNREMAVILSEKNEMEAAQNVNNIIYCNVSQRAPLEHKYTEEKNEFKYCSLPVYFAHSTFSLNPLAFACPSAHVFNAHTHPLRLWWRGSSTAWN